jgi:hypothetical protein
VTEIKILERAGSFAENKDIARDIRLKEITPAYKRDNFEIILNFEGVSGATQSFVHALISQLLKKYGDVVFTRLLFKNCNDKVQETVNTVADYMAES